MHIQLSHEVGQKSRGLLQTADRKVRLIFPHSQKTQVEENSSFGQFSKNSAQKSPEIWVFRLILLYGTFTSEFLDVRVCWTVLYPQGEYVGLSYILKALFTNNRGGCKTVQHCLTYSNIILTSKNSDVNVP